MYNLAFSLFISINEIPLTANVSMNYNEYTGKSLVNEK